MPLPSSGGSSCIALGWRAGEGTTQLGNSVVCGGTGTEEGASLLGPTWALTFEQDLNTAEAISPDQLNWQHSTPPKRMLYTNLYMPDCILYINKLCFKEL